MNLNMSVHHPKLSPARSAKTRGSQYHVCAKESVVNEANMVSWPQDLAKACFAMSFRIRWNSQRIHEKYKANTINATYPTTSMVVVVGEAVPYLVELSELRGITST